MGINKKSSILVDRNIQNCNALEYKFCLTILEFFFLSNNNKRAVSQILRCFFPLSPRWRSGGFPISRVRIMTRFQNFSKDEKYSFSFTHISLGRPDISEQICFFQT